MSDVLALDVDGVLISGFPNPHWSTHLERDLGIDPGLHADFKRWSDLMVQVGSLL